MTNVVQIAMVKGNIWAFTKVNELQAIVQSKEVQEAQLNWGYDEGGYSFDDQIGNLSLVTNFHYVGQHAL